MEGPQAASAPPLHLPRLGRPGSPTRWPPLVGGPARGPGLNRSTASVCSEFPSLLIVCPNLAARRSEEGKGCPSVCPSSPPSPSRKQPLKTLGLPRSDLQGSVKGPGGSAEQALQWPPCPPHSGPHLLHSAGLEHLNYHFPRIPCWFPQAAGLDPVTPPSPLTLSPNFVSPCLLTCNSSSSRHKSSALESFVHDFLVVEA